MYERLKLLANLRNEGIEDTGDFWRVPLVATLEGVQNGALKRWEGDAGLEVSAPWLNGKPFVPQGHPEDPEGHWTVVTDPRQASGFMSDVEAKEVQDTESDSGFHRVLQGIANLQKNDARNEKIIEGLERGDQIEVSVGYHARLEPGEGEFNGKPFDRIETNFYWDHVARVLDGACTFEDGCGLGIANQKACDKENCTGCTHKRESHLAGDKGGNSSGEAPPTNASDKEATKVDDKEAAELTVKNEALARENDGLQGKNDELTEQHDKTNDELKKLEEELATFKDNEAKAVEVRKTDAIAKIKEYNEKVDEEKIGALDVNALETLVETMANSVPAGSTDNSLRQGGAPEDDGKPMAGFIDPATGGWLEYSTRKV